MEQQYDFMKMEKWLCIIVVVLLLELFGGVASARTDCEQKQDRATRYVQRGIPDYYQALQVLAPVVRRCRMTGLAVDAAMYAAHLRRYDEALLWQDYAIRWSKGPSEIRRLQRTWTHYKHKSIENNRRILQQERTVNNDMPLKGRRSARGEFVLKGPALRQRVNIEAQPCKKDRKTKDIVYHRISKPLNKRILFNYRSAKLKAEMIHVLKIMVETLRPILAEGGCVLVVGHTDLLGGHHYNLKLSNRRASSVVRFLVAHGIPKNKIHAAGMGKLQPLIREHDDYAHRQNRRVEFTLFRQ